MRRIALLALALPLALATSYATQSSPAIEGVVLEAGTNRPLERVRVSLASMSDPRFVFGPLPTLGETTTDAQGRFRFEAVKPGRYRVIPALQGFVFSRPARLRAPRESGVWVEAAADGRTEKVQLHMAREGVITGRVLDSNGQPVPGGSAAVMRYRYDEHGARALRGVPGISYPGTAWSFVRTDDRGEYRLYGLQQGDYYVSFSGPGATSTYYPNASDETQAVPVQLKSGEELHLGTATLPPPDKRLQVRLRLTKDGRPLTSGVTVVTIALKPNLIVSTPMKQNEVTFSAPPGLYDALLDNNLGINSGVFYGRVQLDVRERDIDQEVAVTEAARVTSRIALEDSTGQRSPAAGVRCRLILDPPDGRTSDCTRGQVVPRSYRLDLTGMPPDSYVRSATAGGRDILKDGIQIEGDTELDIVIAAPGGVVEGHATNAAGERISDAVVALVPDPPLRAAGLFYRSSISDINGKFQMRGVAPGAYRLFAWSELEGPAYRNAEFLKMFEERGAAVRVEKGTKVSLDVKALDEQEGEGK